MKNIGTADIEANHWIDLTMIGFYDGEKYFLFPSINKFLNHILTEKYHRYKIYFHNGGRYDFLFLIEKLFELGKVDMIQKSGGFIAIFFESKQGIKITFADSIALFPASLEKLINDFNIEYKKIPIDFSIEHKFIDIQLREHLKNDCLSLYKIIEKFYDVEGFLSFTVASHALKVFLKKFFNGTIWNVSDSFDFYFREKYYKGGRVEVYKGYGKNLYYYDINSLYPSVMLEAMPLGSPIKTDVYKKNKIGFYEIKLLEETNFLISPLSIKTKKGNYYVNGEKGDIFNVLSNELEYLIEKKIKFNILSGYYFDKQSKIFEGYVNYYYKQKKESKNETERYIAKLMLNSLYGKFGQRLDGEVIEQLNEKNKDLDNKIYDSYNDLVLVHKKLNVHIKGVYISAYITALARIKHLRLMDSVGHENIYYCDTDSLITSKQLKVSKEIGDIKLEDKIKEGVFITAKVYGYINSEGKEVTHYKGFSKNIFAYNDLKKLLKNEKNELVETKERILSFKDTIRRKNNIKNTKGYYLKTVDQTKVLKSIYERRKKIESKKYIFETIPFSKKDLDIIK